MGARPLYERALAIYEKSLGPEHANTALVRNNLAALRDRRVSTKGDERPSTEPAAAGDDPGRSAARRSVARELAGLAEGP